MEDRVGGSGKMTKERKQEEKGYRVKRVKEVGDKRGE